MRPTRVRVPAAGVPADARHAADLDEKMGLETTSLLCVPVYSKAGAILGVINVMDLCTPLARPEHLENGSLSIDASGTQLYFGDANHHCVYICWTACLCRR